jgi:hypothetical protein
MSTMVTIWAAGALAMTIALAVAARRVGRRWPAVGLVVLGVALVTLEEPALTFWLGLRDAASDKDGLASLVTPMARAHVLDAGVYGVAAAVLLAWIAMTAFKRRERWAWRVLVWGLAVALMTEAATTVLVYSRGLPLPGPAGEAGRAAFGWQPVAVGLLAWAAGLWFACWTRPIPPATPVDAMEGAQR